MSSSRRTRGKAKKPAAAAADLDEPAPVAPPAPAPAAEPPVDTKPAAPPPARPRRRQQQNEASAFLSKTYAMITALRPPIGSWSEAGDSMVITDAEKFASDVIPQYFKHNNFRSFVRQLNFYGFRKLRADASLGPAAASRWEFKHPNFRRGRDDLLVLIRRAEHYDYSAQDVAAQRQRMAELEREVSDLRGKMGTMQNQLDTCMTALRSHGLLDDGPAAKRARLERQDSEQVFLERLPSTVRSALPLDFAPHSLDGNSLSSPAHALTGARALEGQPLARFAAAAAAPGDAARAMEGLPLSALPSNSDGGLNSFENSRLNSLIRTLSEE
eukprot:CAMPEP_0119270376 /NCGR_PEP_ID=MMETSP1329-20130426/7403_1 /TAXON_ID=114041 /ORGANISM="Genus nov. species nov., Strain RCC1024" /LENGTH=327 /DNA_ID=CAMNT_0007270395 /DNA_START=185 /DNA_END=1165 /DNA_ORIENTATION=-